MSHLSVQNIKFIVTKPLKIITKFKFKPGQYM